ncbi:hypothetical protein [Azorhizobium oxalatiphilum]|uniref:hypothetical protein n=1 Tax=Azorhizobium oxalatiphilum TaxID=980631 RepID=UPI00166E62E2|nr:hypothetical protein [Azorhizobium oxalatiphilum]
MNSRTRALAIDRALPPAQAPAAQAAGAGAEAAAQAATTAARAAAATPHTGPRTFATAGARAGTASRTVSVPVDTVTFVPVNQGTRVIVVGDLYICTAFLLEARDEQERLVGYLAGHRQPACDKFSDKLMPFVQGNYANFIWRAIGIRHAVNPVHQGVNSEEKIIVELSSVFKLDPFDLMKKSQVGDYQNLWARRMLVRIDKHGAAKIQETREFFTYIIDSMK